VRCAEDGRAPDCIVSYNSPLDADNRFVLPIASPRFVSLCFPRPEGSGETIGIAGIGSGFAS